MKNNTDWAEVAMYICIAACVITGLIVSAIK